MLCLRLFFDKRRHFPFVVDETAMRAPYRPMFVVDDVCTDFFHEWCIVRYANDCGVGEVAEVVGEPFDCFVIEMVCRL